MTNKENLGAVSLNIMTGKVQLGEPSVHLMEVLDVLKKQSSSTEVYHHDARLRVWNYYAPIKAQTCEEIPTKETAYVSITSPLSRISKSRQPIGEMTGGICQGLNYWSLFICTTRWHKESYKCPTSSIIHSTAGTTILSNLITNSPSSWFNPL